MTDKDKENDKKFKLDDTETNKLMHIDETAIDGIELMAHYKHNHDDEDKPSTEDEKEVKSEETAEEEGDRDMPERDKDMSDRDKDMSERDKEMSDRDKDMSDRDKDMSDRDKDMSDRDKDMSERDKDMSEKEKDSFSEMEDDEKYNKSDTDNESDGRGDKREKNQKFKNLKVFINFYLVKSSRCILHIAIYAIDTVLIYVISFFLTNF